VLCKCAGSGVEHLMDFKLKTHGLA